MIMHWLSRARLPPVVAYQTYTHALYTPDGCTDTRLSSEDQEIKEEVSESEDRGYPPR